MKELDADEALSCHAAKIVSILLQFCKGKIDTLVPQMLAMVVARFITTKADDLKISLLNCVSFGALYLCMYRLQIVLCTVCPLPCPTWKAPSKLQPSLVHGLQH